MEYRYQVGSKVGWKRHVKAGNTYGGSKSEGEDRLSPAAGLLRARPIAFLCSNCGILTFMCMRERLVSGKKRLKEGREDWACCQSSNPVMKDRISFYQIQVHSFFFLLC